MGRPITGVEMSRQLRCALMMLLLVVCTPMVGIASPAFARHKLMEAAPDQSPAPEPGKALLVFFRVSYYGAMFTASVFNAPDDGIEFLGAVDNHQKLAVQMEPGRHRLMVFDENADFLDAELEAGKTYYVLVSPRPGALSMRFSLFPLHNRADAEYSVLGGDFRKWMDAGRYVVRTPKADAWYAANKRRIEEKKASYLVKWNTMSPEDRAQLVLHPEDGVAR